MTNDTFEPLLDLGEIKSLLQQNSSAIEDYYDFARAVERAAVLRERGRVAREEQWPLDAFKETN